MAPYEEKTVMEYILERDQAANYEENTYTQPTDLYPTPSCYICGGSHWSFRCHHQHSPLYLDSNIGLLQPTESMSLLEVSELLLENSKNLKAAVARTLGRKSELEEDPHMSEVLQHEHEQEKSNQEYTQPPAPVDDDEMSMEEFRELMQNLKGVERSWDFVLSSDDPSEETLNQETTMDIEVPPPVTQGIRWVCGDDDACDLNHWVYQGSTVVSEQVDEVAHVEDAKNADEHVGADEKEEEEELVQEEELTSERPHLIIDFSCDDEVVNQQLKEYERYFTRNDVVKEVHEEEEEEEKDEDREVEDEEIAMESLEADDEDDIYMWPVYVGADDEEEEHPDDLEFSNAEEEEHGPSLEDEFGDEILDVLAPCSDGDFDPLGDLKLLEDLLYQEPSVGIVEELPEESHVDIERPRHDPYSISIRDVSRLHIMAEKVVEDHAPRHRDLTVQRRFSDPLHFTMSLGGDDGFLDYMLIIRFGPGKFKCWWVDSISCLLDPESVAAACFPTSCNRRFLKSTDGKRIKEKPPD